MWTTSVGKTRFYMQLIIALLTGRDFLGWKTNGKGTRWLVLQTENGNRRLKSELCSMASILSEEEKRLVNEGVFFHTLETEADSLLSLAVEKNEKEIARLIQDLKPTGVIYDVLRDFGII